MPVTSLAPNKFSSILQGKRQLKQDLEHITQEMYRRNKELADTNRTLSLLRAIDGIVLEPHISLKQVCCDISHVIQSATDYPFTGILLRPPHSEDEMALYGWSVRNNPAASAFLEARRLWRAKLGDRWLSAATEQHELVGLGDVSDDALVLLAGRSLNDVGKLRAILPLQTLYVHKLIVRHHVLGLLAVGFTEATSDLGETNRALLERLGESVGVALDNKLLFEENRSVLRQLRDSNAKLRALDETKDDFISMASHQLRTPLTAIKGYLSMVLDGDAGTISPLQNKMLGQAFTSSQRMVFLITDLLNVSRLKTGKFVIEAVPTNLAELINGEISQLADTAAAKGLKLRYKQPESFPLLMLDELKVRQVIMNFIDNAIYYTPEGGHIDVELSDEPESVELRVIDDGIGVPKAEQYHLFTKFYRAANARKARPDGTGLGLFMAQKIILAQGGAVIFSSTENEGSTFGFSFPKATLAVTEQPASR